MELKNQLTGQILTYEEFVSMVWENLEDTYGENWCNLTKSEQIYRYCQEVDRLLKCGHYEYYGV